MPLNPEAECATFNLTAYDNNGNLVGTSPIKSIAGYAKTADVVQNYFYQDITHATYLIYSSNKNLVGFQLNGSAKRLILEGLPPWRYFLLDKRKPSVMTLAVRTVRDVMAAGHKLTVNGYVCNTSSSGGDEGGIGGEVTCPVSCPDGYGYCYEITISGSICECREYYLLPPIMPPGDSHRQNVFCWKKSSIKDIMEKF